ncbi:MAG TPA: hypothetical protein VK718_08620 [Ferruginibacter sp.]|jgi:hypothetical protein|nr:hypothetical protein [Ferruginibacter sp.]
MWNKIKASTDIQAGIIVKKNPLEGNPTDDIEQSDPRNSSTYCVTAVKQVDGPDDEISLAISSIASPDIHPALSTKMMATDGDIPLVKMRKEFVEENCWWVFTLGGTDSQI